MGQVLINIFPSNILPILALSKRYPQDRQAFLVTTGMNGLI